LIASLISWLDTAGPRIVFFLRQRKGLILTLAALALIAYGFELFNFTLGIDEEVNALYGEPRIFVSSGRWGMYLLNRLLLPYPVIPFLPLFLGLAFHVLGALLLLDAWQVQDKTEQVITGALFVLFPIVAYMYAFTILSYGIGIGLFLTGLSLWLFERGSGWRKAWAVLPAAFALGIYQGFALTLAAAFLMTYLLPAFRGQPKNLRPLLQSAGVGLAAGGLYLLVHKLATTLIVPESNYIAGYFVPFDYILTHKRMILNAIWTVIRQVYSGDPVLYGSEAPTLQALMVVSAAAILIRLARLPFGWLRKLVLATLIAGLALFSFAFGIFTGGQLVMRFLFGLQVVVAGFVLLALTANHRLARLLITLLAAFSLLQFTASINHLFGASHLRLQQDRQIATNLIDRTEAARAAAGALEVQRIEVIGYWEAPGSELIPKSEAFGASFFEWDQGNAERIIPFLEIMGYRKLTTVPREERIALIPEALPMPNWPAEGSVKVVGDTALVKFSDYSFAQKRLLCADPADVPLSGFCP
jgi:hypothetical protein